MSDPTPEERRRILRERRQAKMTGGKALERLNDILSQGSSVKASSAVSVMDKPEKEAITSTIADDTQNTIQHLEHDADPDVQDIDTIVNENQPGGQDIDELFKNIFSGGLDIPGGEGAGEDPIAQMMKQMMQGQSATSSSPFGTAKDTELEAYLEKMAIYKLYQKKLWKFRFLIIRYSIILTSFIYYYKVSSGKSFEPSTYSYIRAIEPEYKSGFITTFFTAEFILLGTYYLVSSTKGLFQVTGDNSVLLKLHSWASLVLPQLNQYKSLLFQIVSYQEILGMFLSDLSLVVVLFAIISYIT
ncbi:uncharacterized protein PRCAT00002576001 [Priceomyces carsonii]|uniref:uncharacterized protein n=1 Tax=Priceomyces carsonii TaxID=28549 RepID=UPI002EDB097B|nr:unnamed protein product [Priceomyces carsonii]